LSSFGRDLPELVIDQQVTAHEMALSLHQNYASSGDTPALRKTAQAAVPIIQQHLTTAQQLD
jgi:putative membrane protein